MGQSSFNIGGYGGGGGSSNWWTNGGAGTTIFPIAIVTAIDTTLGFFRWAVNTLGLNGLLYDDGAGNQTFFAVIAGAAGMNSEDAAGNQSNITALANNPNMQCLDTAGNVANVALTPASVNNNVTDPAGNESGIVITAVSASIVANAAGGGGTKLLGVNTTDNGIVTDQVALSPGVMPAVTVGKLDVYDAGGIFLGSINLT